VAELGCGEGTAVPPQVGAGLVAGGQSHHDDQGDGAGSGARVHELDRGQHRRGNSRPQWLGWLAAGRVRLIHGDLCTGSLPKQAQFPALNYRA
jgi:hypothetical protein